MLTPDPGKVASINECSPAHHEKGSLVIFWSLRVLQEAYVLRIPNFNTIANDQERCTK